MIEMTLSSRHRIRNSSPGGGVASGSGNILSSGVVIVGHLPNYIVSLFRGLRCFYACGGVTACGL